MRVAMSLLLLLLVRLLTPALAGGGLHTIAGPDWTCPMGTDCVKPQVDYSGTRTRYPKGGGPIARRFGRQHGSPRTVQRGGLCSSVCAG